MWKEMIDVCILGRNWMIHVLFEIKYNNFIVITVYVLINTSCACVYDNKLPGFFWITVQLYPSKHVLMDGCRCT